MQFLVDNGANINIIPVTSSNKESSECKLYAEDGVEIEILAQNFVIAKTTKEILGADFLNKYNLLIDLNNNQLTGGKTKFYAKAEVFSINFNINTLNKTLIFKTYFRNNPIF